MVQLHPLAHAQFVGKAHRSETKFEKGASDRNLQPGKRVIILRGRIKAAFDIAVIIARCYYTIQYWTFINLCPSRQNKTS